MSPSGRSGVVKTIESVDPEATVATCGVDSRAAECPLCGGGNLVPAYSGVRDRLAYVDGEFDFLRCDRCQSVSLFPLPEEQKVASFYPESYMVEAPNSRLGVAGLLRSIEWRTLFLPVYMSGAKAVIAMTGLKRGRILEIGCSSGYQLHEFAKLGDFELTGLDIDGPATDHARRVLGLNAINGTLGDAHFPPASFDLVILFNVLEHLPRPLEMLEEISRVLKPGGYLAVKTQFIDSMQARVLKKRWVWLQEAPRHVFLPSTRGLRLLVGGAEMRITSGRAGHVLENSIGIALSVFPKATSGAAFRGGRHVLGYVRRLVGVVLGLASMPLAIVETIIGVGGTMIYVAKKDEQGSLIVDREPRKRCGKGRIC
jgi:SAM-dependent methyltransferase